MEYASEYIKEIRFEWLWNICPTLQEFGTPIALTASVSIAVYFTFKIVFKFIIPLFKKDELGELIKECGNMFVSLQYGNQYKDWIVRAAIADSEKGLKEFYGKTAIEAVRSLLEQLKENK